MKALSQKGPVLVQLAKEIYNVRVLDEKGFEVLLMVGSHCQSILFGCLSVHSGGTADQSIDDLFHLMRRIVCSCLVVIVVGEMEDGYLLFLLVGIERF